VVEATTDERAAVTRPLRTVRRSADDPETYAEVFAHHQPYVLRLAYLLCGDRHRAEDLAAEAFARVYPHWRRGAVLDERAYLRRAVVNEANSRGRRSVLERRELERRTAAGRGDRRADDHVVDRDLIHHALRQLPARQRAVIVLRYYEDLTEADTAAVLGMRIGTVKSQTARGMARLRTILEGSGR
jgi:RNA polymerase sigma-70 factor (sigma-E family)